MPAIPSTQVETWELSLCVPRVARDPAMWIITCCFLKYILAGNWSWEQSQDTNSVTGIRDVCIPHTILISRLNACPQNFFFFSFHKTVRIWDSCLSVSGYLSIFIPIYHIFFILIIDGPFYDSISWLLYIVLQQTPCMECMDLFDITTSALFYV